MADAWQWVGLVFLAGLLRGFTGFGFGLTAVPLLSLVMAPARAVPIVLLLQMLVSTAGLRDAVRQCDWRSIRLLALGAVVGTPLGAVALAHLAAAPVRLVIAVVVAGGAVVLAGGLRLRRAPSGWGVLPFGVLSGLFNGLAGIPGPPVIAFYLASPVATGIARASMIVFFLATSIIALAPLAWLGLLGRGSLLNAAIGLPAVLFGSWLGGRMYRGGADRHYRRVALAAAAVHRDAFRIARSRRLCGLVRLSGAAGEQGLPQRWAEI